MRMYDIIENKRNGKELTDDEIKFFINGYTDGSIPDYQASALCMAVYFKGMTEKETVILTEAMANSGDTVDLSMFVLFLPISILRAESATKQALSLRRLLPL